MENRIKVADLKREHLEWRDKNFKVRKGFYPVFTDFKEYMKELSPGAISLFLYLGLHSNNLTGEVTHGIERMANFFDKTPRTISKWLKELEDLKLIYRVQLKFNGPSHTFILPYEKTNAKKSKMANEDDLNLEDKLPF